MEDSSRRMSKSEADTWADEIADADGVGDMYILDIDVVNLERGHAIRVAYEVLGEERHRMLTNVRDVQRFLYEPLHLPHECSPDVESWDADMGL